MPRQIFNGFAAQQEEETGAVRGTIRARSHRRLVCHRPHQIYTRFAKAIGAKMIIGTDYSYDRFRNISETAMLKRPNPRHRRRPRRAAGCRRAGGAGRARAGAAAAGRRPPAVSRRLIHHFRC